MIKELLRRYDNYALSVSMTSRNPRPGEAEGREYFFVTREKFEQTIREDGLIEHACYVGNYYGTPKAYVEECLSKGRDVILEIEIQGALQIKKKFPDAVLMFVMPPSADTLYARLTGRGTEDHETIVKRMQRAVEESAGIEEYDYIIVNDDLDESVETMHNVIRAAHLSPKRNIAFIEKVRDELTSMKTDSEPI